MTKGEFEIEIKKNFKNIDKDFFKKIEIYKEFLQEQNSLLNLTNLASEDKIYGTYFYDSLIQFINIKIDNQKILDIGSGSGIPSIPLLLMYPKIKLCIIEPTNKKCNFIQKLCDKLKVNVELIPSRAEDIYKKYIETFDIVTSRAVASVRIMLELSIQYTKINGMIIIPKGTGWKEEIEDAKKIMQKILISKYELNSINSPSGYTNNILTFTKEKKTPLNYPRKWSVIKNGI